MTYKLEIEIDLSELSYEELDELYNLCYVELMERGQLDPNMSREEELEHAALCCVDHGCRIGSNNECPVTLGVVTQIYPCTYCNDEEVLEAMGR